ncbi:hypothetical protein [Brevibacillus laterosporus]|uniref:hypothetical protein n=1 Tax=Brevibacillus laterosporus TaxID=1465 RepID=UPI0018CCA6A3|nr:hypothetical protein [Brevibacillus laterosporus]MBG9789751.1 hypothetical protein [Brevibacillus laterosporus]
MGYTTYATLLYQIDKEHVQTILKQKNIKSYLYPINESWTAVMLSDEEDGSDEFAAYISEITGQLSMYVASLPNQAWGFSCYLNGEVLVSWFIQYNDVACDLQLEGTLSTLSDWVTSPSSFERFMNYTLQNESAEKALGEARALFLQAFDIADVEGWSFAYLSRQTSQFLQQHRILINKCRRSPVRVKKMIKACLQEHLLKAGFVLSEAVPTPNQEGGKKGRDALEQFAFYRATPAITNTGLLLTFHKRQRKFTALLQHASYGSIDLWTWSEGKWGRTHGVAQWRSYADEQELVEYLYEVAHLFVEYGPAFFQQIDHNLEVFSPRDLLLDIADKSLISRGFLRESTNEYTSYVNDQYELSFTHTTYPRQLFGRFRHVSEPTVWHNLHPFWLDQCYYCTKTEFIHLLGHMLQTFERQTT